MDNKTFKYKCPNCDFECEAQRHERSKKDYPSIVINTGMNMVYSGKMNREYCWCPSCGVVEDQWSAECRDQSEEAENAP